MATIVVLRNPPVPEESINAYTSGNRFDFVDVSVPLEVKRQNISAIPSIQELRKKYPGKVRSLRLKAGQTKTLAAGISVKKIDDDRLELYFPE